MHGTLMLTTLRRTDRRDTGTLGRLDGKEQVVCNKWSGGSSWAWC